MFKDSAQPARRHQDVRGLPRRRDGRGGFRSLRRAAAPAPRTTEDYLRERERSKSTSKAKLTALTSSVAFSRNSTSAVAVFRRADGLLRHLGAGRVGHRADLEQLRHRLRRPHDVELLQRVGEIVARQRRDPAAEDAVPASAPRGCLRRASACGRRRRRDNTSAPRSPRIGRQRIVRRCHRHRADVLAGRPRSSAGPCGRCRRSAACGCPAGTPPTTPAGPGPTSVRASVRVRAVDDRDRAADAGGGDQRAVGRHRERDDRRLADLRPRRAARRAATGRYTVPSAPPATISPSRATATALSGVGSVTMVGAPPSSGQMRSVGS